MSIIRRFFRRFLALSGATILGQVVFFLTAPLITRLYTPEHFSAYAVSLSIVTILVSLSSLRYALGQTRPPGELAGKGLFLLSLIILILGSVPASILSFFIGGRFFGENALPLFLLPPVYFFMGLQDILLYRQIRLKNFKMAALSKTLLPLGVVCGQVLGGLLGWGGAGLLGANLLGNALACFLLLPGAFAGPRFFQNGWKKSAGLLLKTALRYKEFPLYSAPAWLVDVLANQTTPLLMVSAFGSSLGGQYVLVHRVLKQPSALLGLSLSQAFLGEMSGSPQQKKGEIRALAKKTLKGLVLVSLPFLVLGMVFSPRLFPLFFGGQWQFAGEMARILIPAYWVSFLYLPFHMIMEIYGKTWGRLIFEGLRFLFTFATLFFWGKILGLGWSLTLSILSALLMLLYLAGLAANLFQLREKSS